MGRKIYRTIILRRYCMEDKAKLIDKFKVMKEVEKKPRSSFGEIENKVKEDTKEIPINVLSYKGIKEEVNSLLNSVGIQGNKILPIDKIIVISVLTTLAQESTHIAIVGKASSGKTALFDKVFPEISKVMSGEVTVPQLFGSISGNQKKEGIVNRFLAGILDDFQNFSATNELAGKMFGFLSTGDSSRSGDEESKKSGCSLNVILNPPLEIQEELYKSPYTRDLKQLLTDSLPEKFKEERFFTRIIFIPWWICRENFPILIDTKESYGYTIEYLEDRFKKTREGLIEVASFDNLSIRRVKDKANNLYNGFLKLFANAELDDNDKEGLKFISAQIANIGHSNKKLHFTGNTAVNQLLIKLCGDFLPYPTTSIIEAYALENRAIVRFNEEKDCFFKVALDKQGIAYNKEEVEIYQKFPLLRDELVETEKIDEEFICIRAKTKFSPNSEYHKIKDCLNIFGAKPEAPELNDEVKEYINARMKQVQDSFTEKTAEMKAELNLMRKYLNEIVLLQGVTTASHKAFSFYQASDEEIEKEIIREIEFLKNYLKVENSDFKSYYFIWDSYEKKVKLLHYHFISGINSKECFDNLLKSLA